MRFSSFSRCVAIVAFVGIAAQPARAQTETSPEARVDRLVKDQMRKQRIPGLSLAVVKDEKVMKSGGYGLANLETSTSATAETRYKVASVGKSIMAAGIMILVQDGKLKLDDKVSAHLPGTPPSWKAITVGRLLSHTSGLIENPPGFLPFKARPVEEVVASGFPKPLLFAPGDSWSYSNLAYFAAAAIIEQTTGQPWSRFIDERILQPAGMTSTRPTTTLDLVPQRADGYLLKNLEWKKAEDWVAVRPSGPFLSTVLDLARWDAFLTSGTVLKPESVATMQAPTRLNNGNDYPYGLGLDLKRWQGHKQISHGGQLPGFASAFHKFPDDNLTVIVLTNLDDADAAKISLEIAGIYIPALAPPILKPIPETEPELSEKARRMIRGFAAGEVDMNLFTKPAKVAIPKSTIAAELREWGAIQAIELVQREEKDSRRVHWYRVRFPDASLFVICEFDPESKISQFNVESD